MTQIHKARILDAYGQPALGGLGIDSSAAVPKARVLGISAAAQAAAVDRMAAEAEEAAKEHSAVRKALGTDDPMVIIEAFIRAAAEDPRISAAVLLPLLFTLGGMPYTLLEHWLFEPLFRIFRQPKIRVILAARQTGKTQNVSGEDLLVSSLVPFMKTLLVTPLYEQARRWSNNYIKPLLDGCLIPGLLTVGKSKENNSVLQRGFPNGSFILFSFAYLDCERIRGVSAQRLGIDEVQGLNPTFIPIIRETLSGQRIGFERYTGTPKTKDNTAWQLYQQTSQGAWAIQCSNKHENIFSDDFDILKNIGKTGPICRICSNPLNPRDGYYVHKHPDKMWYAEGYIVPQIVHPLHTNYENKWNDILYKMENMTEAQFKNECLALASDVGARLVTEDMLRAASVLPYHPLEEVANYTQDRYVMTVTATDWGGRGKRKNAKRVSDETLLEFASYTANAVVGLTSDGHFDVVFGERLDHDLDPVIETKRAVTVHLESRSHIWAYDATGAGEVRVTMALQTIFDAGLGPEDIMPVQYTSLSPRQPIMILALPNASSQAVQHVYQMDKHRAGFLVAFMIRKGLVRFMDYDKSGKVASDFISWYEDTQETYKGNKFTTLQRDPNRPDDVAQAIVIAICALCHANNAWPDLAAFVSNYAGMGDNDIESINPAEPEWDSA